MIMTGKIIKLEKYVEECEDKLLDGIGGTIEDANENTFEFTCVYKEIIDKIKSLFDENAVFLLGGNSEYSDYRLFDIKLVPDIETFERNIIDNVEYLSDQHIQKRKPPTMKSIEDLIEDPRLNKQGD